jgi:hypothetical protein
LQFDSKHHNALTPLQKFFFKSHPTLEIAGILSFDFSEEHFPQRAEQLLKAEELVLQFLQKLNCKADIKYHDDNLSTKYPENVNPYHLGNTVLLRSNVSPTNQYHKAYPRYKGPYVVVKTDGVTCFLASLKTKYLDSQVLYPVKGNSKALPSRKLISCPYSYLNLADNKHIDKQDMHYINRFTPLLFFSSNLPCQLLSIMIENLKSKSSLEKSLASLKNASLIKDPIEGDILLSNNTDLDNDSEFEITHFDQDLELVGSQLPDPELAETIADEVQTSTFTLHKQRDKGHQHTTLSKILALYQPIIADAMVKPGSLPTTESYFHQQLKLGSLTLTLLLLVMDTKTNSVPMKKKPKQLPYTVGANRSGTSRPAV